MAQEILLEKGVELRSVDVSEPVVIEAEIDAALRLTRCAPRREQLLQETGLAGPPHADDCMCFAAQRGQQGSSRLPYNCPS